MAVKTGTTLNVGDILEIPYPRTKEEKTEWGCRLVNMSRKKKGVQALWNRKKPLKFQFAVSQSNFNISYDKTISNNSGETMAKIRKSFEDFKADFTSNCLGESLRKSTNVTVLKFYPKLLNLS